MLLVSKLPFSNKKIDAVTKLRSRDEAYVAIVVTSIVGVAVSTFKMLFSRLMGIHHMHNSAVFFLATNVECKIWERAVEQM